MSETAQSQQNVIDELLASLWSVMPAEAANTIVGLKKDFLTRVRSTVDAMVDHDLQYLDWLQTEAERKRATQPTPPATENPAP